MAISHSEFTLCLYDPLFWDLIDICAKMIDDDGIVNEPILENSKKKGEGKKRNQSRIEDGVKFFHLSFWDECIMGKTASATGKNPFCATDGGRYISL